MINEYRLSLQLFEWAKEEYAEIYGNWTKGISNPEEEMLLFLRDLKRSWHMMWAIEQRHEYRTMADFVGNRIQGIRQLAGRPGVYGTGKYRTIYGSVEESRGTMDGLLDDSIHHSKRVLTLEIIEKMAETIEKREEVPKR